MTADISSRKALILSPTASHPQDYGNRNRVLQTTSHFKKLGYEIHFILYPFEEDWKEEIPPSADEMRKAWTSFTTVPPSRPLHALAAGEHHQIDEWWDPQIGFYLEWLFRREFFDVFVVNYTFLSKAFEFAPRSTVKVLETHDMFSGRKEIFASFGAPPEFFYTTPEEEGIALDRADIVVAIKEAEANVFRGLTSRQVVSLPFFVSAKSSEPRSARTQPVETLRIGFIGALNAVNAVNMQLFLDRYAKFEKIYCPNMEIVIAGNVCSRLTTTSPSVTLLGRVESLEEYYGTVDVIVAPMVFSTGLKIKVGEALSYGKPIVATRNGFDGFPALDEFHLLDDIDGVCRALMKLSFDRQRLRLLETRTAVAASLAERRNEEGFAKLTEAINRNSKRIVFITDQEVWKTDSVQQERIAQWCELCTFMTRITVIYMGRLAPEKIEWPGLRLSQIVDVLSFPGDTDAAAESVEQISRTHRIIDLVISVGPDLARPVWESVAGRFRHITVDTWVPALTDVVDCEDVAGSGILLTGEPSADGLRMGRHLETTAFRYLPERLGAMKYNPALSTIVAVLCTPDEFDRFGIDRLRSAPSIGSSLIIIDYSESCERELFEQLTNTGVPRVIIAVGRDRRAVEVCRCIAAYWGIEWLHVSSTEFPRALSTGNGSVHMCANFADLAEYLGESKATGGNMSAHAGDGGWSTYWRFLAGR